MKFEAVRGLSLMGFTKMDNIKQHQFIGSSVQVLVANPDDPVRLRGRRMESGIAHSKRGVLHENFISADFHDMQLISQFMHISWVMKCSCFMRKLEQR